MPMKLSTDSYKGVRDFYPEDQFIQDYIFFIWESTLESFGYEKYHASILEPTDIYRAKTGEEIVNEQIYNFTDRGDRDVTLRPEMTPTIARMIAKHRRELQFPLRWYSIPNLFRYERPQRGRLREHWQLNADFFGVQSIEAETELIEIAATLLRNFGLNDTQFEIKVNDLVGLDKALTNAGLSEIDAHMYRKLLDKKEKIDDFDEQVEKALGRKVVIDLQPSESTQAVIDKLRERGISNVTFAPSIVRGFDYYTGIVFEVFSTDPQNRRSLFGGGRYDKLLEIFDEMPIPAVGFGMGDVTVRDVLETYNLLPQYEATAQLTLCPLNDSYFDITSLLAQDLRKQGLQVSVDYSGKKLGEQISRADKRKIPFIICLGEDEITKDTFTIKDLRSGTEKTMSQKKVVAYIKKSL